MPGNAALTAKNGSGINIEAVGSTRRLNLLRLEPYAGKLARTVLRGGGAVMRCCYPTCDESRVGS